MELEKGGYVKTTFSIRGRTIRYRAIFSGVVIFVGAFLLGFIAATMNNPVGESWAEPAEAVTQEAGE